ncbi:hypothetical protein EYZ11_013397 [Aspergillus tanneri]|uniref:DUF1275 domain protein n=1 Tax=Aspergillus tanneri TaxID=1220188 RepID=A0A4S3IZW1_9EURO|nr:uncharacterized protein ATNIH1004_005350 [Aspergillus tanneri]KAA8646675.1 hypothetical protein ATNIH1004_005350 [Aspergillus tanneri]THC87157.1 hypothetical protein EYZ11_013397 [Aspergillus tanneri]
MPPTAPPSNLVIYWDTPPNPSLPRLDDESKESKDPTRLLSVGGSTTVSLSGTFTEEMPLHSTLTRHFMADIDTTHTDIILILCSFVSGLVDGLSFNAWGSFSSMQTGNTVFIALGVSGQPEYPAYLWAKSLISLTTFIISNILFIHVSRILRPRRRSTFILSFGIQTAAIFVAAILVQLKVVSPRPEDPRSPIEWMQILPISLLAFQAGGQICASRILAIDEIPTVVLTTLLCDLLVDPKLFSRGWRSNPRRNRRVGAFLALFSGAMTAGGLTKVTEMAASLWLAMGLKFIITVGWMVWRSDQTKKQDVEG